MARKIAAGNWKMNGLAENLAEVDALADAVAAASCDVLLCPPATLIAAMAARAGLMDLYIGGQTCHPAASGAHTGDISATMLADAGATHVIVGHSERRADHGETSEDVAAQVTAAIDAGLIAIICVGETEAERDAEVTLNVVGTQLARSVPTGATPDQIIVAYEPVWAIGTGVTATSEQAQQAHAFVRSLIAGLYGSEPAAKIRIQYGGSVKPASAAELMACPDIDGALIGGAALEPQSFLEIIKNGTAE